MLDARGWFDVLSFDLTWVSPLDVEMANDFYSTHPRVPFTNQLMCMVKRPEGLTELREGALMRFGPNLAARERTELRDVEQLRTILTGEFGLPLEGDLLDRVWAKLSITPTPGVPEMGADGLDPGAGRPGPAGGPAHRAVTSGSGVGCAIPPAFGAWTPRLPPLPRPTARS